MCICDDEYIDKGIVLDGNRGRIEENSVYLEMTFMRGKWAARLFASVIINDERETCITKGINYCPICGRRLSLADAVRKKKEEEDWWN